MHGHAEAPIPPDAQSASIRRSPASHRIRPLPRKASSPRLGPPRRGRPRTPGRKAWVDRGMCPVRQPGSCVIKGWKWNASALVRPCHADAQSASLRENHPPRCPRVYSPRPLSQASPPWRGGLRPPAKRSWPFTGPSPLRATSFPLAPPNNEGPPHPLGRATRAPRVRPSKKPPLAYFGTYPAKPSLSGPHSRGDELLDKLGWTIHYRELGGMLGWREFETDPSASDTSEATREAHNPRRSGGKVSFVILGACRGSSCPSRDDIAFRRSHSYEGSGGLSYGITLP